MEITERLIRRIARQEFGQMVKSSAYTRGNGGEGSYVLPLAADGVRGGVQVGYTTDATARKYAVQLDNEKMYVNVPWTDHYAWGDITNKPSAAGGGTTPVYWTGSGFTACTPYSQASVNYATSAGSASSATTAGTATYANSAGSASSAGYATEAGSAGYATSAGSAGSAGYAGYITDGTMDAIAERNNELNFGGSDGSSTIYFGYRSRGSKAIPTSFIFGGGSGSASITCARVYSNGGVTALSDARKKDVLGDVELSVEDIARMPAVRFEWKDPKKPGMFIGTLAQSWREILPEAVQPIGDSLGLDYNGAAIVAVVNLAKAVQKIIDKMNRYGFK